MGQQMSGGTRYSLEEQRPQVNVGLLTDLESLFSPGSRAGEIAGGIDPIW